MSGYRITSLEDLLKEAFPYEPIVEGLINRRESLLICGKSGIGKSVLTLNLALYMA